MNGPSGIGQTPGVNTPETTNRPQRVVSQELEERLLLARLFGAKDAPAQSKPAASTSLDNPNDDVEPHLGRHVDVIA